MGRTHAPIEGIWPRFYCREPKPALTIRELDSITLEIRIKRRGIRVGRMVVAAKSVGLPELDARLKWFTALIENASRNVNDLPVRPRATTPQQCQVGILFQRSYDGVERT